MHPLGDLRKPSISTEILPENYGTLFDTGDLSPDEMIFSDESHLWLNGYTSTSKIFISG